MSLDTNFWGYCNFNNYKFGQLALPINSQQQQKNILSLCILRTVSLTDMQSTAAEEHFIFVYSLRTVSLTDKQSTAAEEHFIFVYSLQTVSLTDMQSTAAE